MAFFLYENLTLNECPYLSEYVCSMNKCSCKEIYEANPRSESRYYQIETDNGYCCKVYCVMEGAGGGGWILIAKKCQEMF